jgi:galacturan 1,4-alpha-galacturonidase
MNMKISLAPILLVALATTSVASPTWQSFQKWARGLGGKTEPEHTSPRPPINCHPKSPHKPPPSPPPRHKVCYVKSHNDGITDDTSYILDALHSCNNGGHVVFKEGTEYLIGTALDLTFLNHIDLGMKC